MKNIKIEEYEHKYAAATAVMWQNSAKGWNGETFLTTAQDVITDEENSIHLNAWLALDGDLVVGYCNLYEYQEDTGALYIGLLNVRDDYQGRKIGKALVLKAVERTIELGWDRLDLYTWSGNTLAVPLYKKTGFFWEDRDDTTHLINLIPSVLKNELIKDHFKEIDWYNDSIRPIEVKPDGRKENEFEYLTYEWKKDDKYLLMEYCRRGRGLRKIETDEYSISVTVEDLKLVFGSKYKVRYNIVNKTDKPLKLNIKGLNEKNIEFDLQKEITVENKLSFNAEFKVNEVEKEQSVWKTHPCVVSEISIKGKKSLFKVGIEPKFPAKIILTKRSGISYPDVESGIYIDIENSFDTDATFQFELLENESIEFPEKKFSIALKAKEKRSIPIKYILKKGCVYSPEISVQAIRENCDPLVFKRRINCMFNAISGIFYGETQMNFIVGNGSYYIIIMRKDFYNIFLIGDAFSQGCKVSYRVPKLGKPFSDEFNKKPCDKVEYLIEGTAIILKAYYTSDKFKGIKFQINHKLFANGIVERWLEFESNGAKENLFFKDSIGMRSNRLIVPYDGDFIDVRDEVTGGTGDWNSEKLSENWIFRRGKRSSVGICWSDDVKMKFGNWEKFFEYDLGNLKVGEKLIFKPVTIALDTFRDWHKFREFTLKKHQDRENMKESLEFSINRGNPFVQKSFPVSVIEHRKKNKNGKIFLKFKKDKKTKLLGSFSEKNDIKKVGIEFKYDRDNQLDILIMEAKFEEIETSREKVIFPIGKEKISSEELKLEGMNVMKLDNGIISMETSASFAPSLYSLKYKGIQWLDSSFPKPCSKGWWKPWVGGICTLPSQLRVITILEENNSAKFVKKTDNLGNNWEGFCISTEIVKNEKFKGLKLDQYFLLLPGVPVMFHTLEILQNTGKFMRDVEFETACFIKPDEDLQKCYFLAKNKEGQEFKVNAGKKLFEVEASSLFSFAGDNREELLQIYLASEETTSWLCADTQLLNAWIGDKLNCENNKRIYLSSRFFIFAEQKLNDEMLRDLKHVGFET
ncbi:MAG: GNAT family N-acetyltransferase [Armatimonadetes bacterium]|nr:GNAT family N-acetyltransferase [Armatimonadota bacterium]